MNISKDAKIYKRKKAHASLSLQESKKVISHSNKKKYSPDVQPESYDIKVETTSSPMNIYQDTRPSKALMFPSSASLLFRIMAE